VAVHEPPTGTVFKLKVTIRPATPLLVARCSLR
jgi:hypothetical protein